MPAAKYPGLKKWVKNKLIEGARPGDIYETAVRRFRYENSQDQFGHYCRGVRRTEKLPPAGPANQYTNGNGHTEEPVDEDAALFLAAVQNKKQVEVLALCEQLDCKPKQIFEYVEYFRTKGVELSLQSGVIFFNTSAPAAVEPVSQIAETEIVFGVASDLHFGSKHCQITALNTFCEICKKKGVKHMFSPGDVVAGYNVYPGQQFDVYALSAQEQESSVVTNLPTGFEWYLLGGNHDYAFIKRGGGHNPVLSIASQREDCHYVGFDQAIIPILNGVDLSMWHPSGGVPYSVSYRLQKGVEQIAYSELTNIVRGVKDKPTIRFILSGHLHIQMQALFGSIFGCQCGTFEGQTNYLQRKNLVPNIGGYIIKAELGRNGLLRNFEAKFYVFEEVEDDWKNYRHSVISPKIEKPVFA